MSNKYEYLLLFDEIYANNSFIKHFYSSNNNNINNNINNNNNKNNNNNNEVKNNIINNNERHIISNFDLLLNNYEYNCENILNVSNYKHSKIENIALVNNINCYENILNNRVALCELYHTKIANNNNNLVVVDDDDNNNNNNIKKDDVESQTNGMLQLTMSMLIPIIETLVVQNINLLPNIMNRLENTLSSIPLFSLTTESLTCIQEWYSIFSQYCDKPQLRSQVLSVMFGFAIQKGNISLLLDCIIHVLSSSNISINLNLLNYIRQLENARKKSGSWATDSSFLCMWKHNSASMKHYIYNGDAQEKVILNKFRANNIWGSQNDDDMSIHSNFNAITVLNGYLYILNHQGLICCGTGYNSTIQKHIYGFNSKFALNDSSNNEKEQSSYLLIINNRLLLVTDCFKQNSLFNESNMHNDSYKGDFKYFVLEICPYTLKIIGTLPIVPTLELGDNVKYEYITNDINQKSILALRSVKSTNKFSYIRNKCQCVDIYELKIEQDKAVFSCAKSITLDTTNLKSKRDLNNNWEMDNNLVGRTHTKYKLICTEEYWLRIRMDRYEGERFDNTNSNHKQDIFDFKNGKYINCSFCEFASSTSAVGLSICYDRDNKIFFDYDDRFNIRVFSNIVHPHDDNENSVCKVFNLACFPLRNRKNELVFQVKSKSDLSYITRLLRICIKLKSDITTSIIINCTYLLSNQINSLNFIDSNEIHELKKVLINCLESCNCWEASKYKTLAIKHLTQSLINGGHLFWKTVDDWIFLFEMYTTHEWVRNILKSDSLLKNDLMNMKELLDNNKFKDLLKKVIDHDFETFKEIINNLIKTKENNCMIPPLLYGASHSLLRVYETILQEPNQYQDYIVDIFDGCVQHFKWINYKLSSINENNTIECIDKFVQSIFVGNCIHNIIYVLLKKDIIVSKIIYDSIPNLTRVFDHYNQKVCKLNDIENDMQSNYKRKQKQIEERIVESAHPLIDKNFTYRLVMNDDVDFIVLQFDSRSILRADDGYLSITDGHGNELYAHLNLNNESSHLVVAGNVVKFQYFDIMIEDVWGFKCTATSFRAAKPLNLPWSLDIQMSLAQLIQEIFAKLFIPLNNSTSYDIFLESELFAMGIRNNDTSLEYHDFINTILNKTKSNDLVMFMRNNVSGRPFMSKQAQNSMDEIERYLSIVTLYHLNLLNNAIDLSKDLNINNRNFIIVKKVWERINRMLNQILLLARLQKRWNDAIKANDLSDIGSLDSQSLSLLCQLQCVHYDGLDLKATMSLLLEKLRIDHEKFKNESWIIETDDVLSWQRAYKFVTQHVIERCKVLLKLNYSPLKKLKKSTSTLDSLKLQRTLTEPYYVNKDDETDEVLVLGRSLSFRKQHSEVSSTVQSNKIESESDMKVSFHRWKSWKKTTDSFMNLNDLSNDSTIARLQQVSSFVFTCNDPNKCLTILQNRIECADNRCNGIEFLTTCLQNISSSLSNSMILLSFKELIQKYLFTPYFLDQLKGCNISSRKALQKSWFKLIDMLLKILNNNTDSYLISVVCIDIITIKYCIDDEYYLMQSSIFDTLESVLNKSTNILVRNASRNALLYLASVIAWWTGDSENIEKLQNKIFDIIFKQFITSSYLVGDKKSMQMQNDKKQIDHATKDKVALSKNSMVNNDLTLDNEMDTSKINQKKAIMEEKKELEEKKLEEKQKEEVKNATVLNHQVHTNNDLTLGKNSLEYKDEECFRLLSVIYRLRGVELTQKKLVQKSTIDTLLNFLNTGTLRIQRLSLRLLKFTMVQNNFPTKLKEKIISSLWTRFGELIGGINFTESPHLKDINERFENDEDSLTLDNTDDLKSNDDILYIVKMYQSELCNSTTLISNYVLLCEEGFASAVKNSGLKRQQYLDNIREQLQYGSATIYSGLLNNCKSFARKISQCGFTIKIQKKPLHDADIRNEELAQQNPSYYIDGYASMTLTFEILRLFSAISYSNKWCDLLNETFRNSIKTLHMFHSLVNEKSYKDLLDDSMNILAGLTLIGGFHQCLHIGGTVCIKVGYNDDENIRHGCLVEYERGKQKCLVVFLNNGQIETMEVNANCLKPINDDMQMSPNILSNIDHHIVESMLNYVSQSMEFNINSNNNKNNNNNNNNIDGDKKKKQNQLSKLQLELEIRLKCVAAMNYIFKDKGICNRVFESNIQDLLINTLLKFANNCSPSSSFEQLYNEYIRWIQRFYDLKRPPISQNMYTLKTKGKESSKVSKELPYILGVDSTTSLPTCFSIDGNRFVLMEDDENRILQFTRSKNIKSILSNIGLDSSVSQFSRSQFVKEWIIIANCVIPTNIQIFYFEIELLSTHNISIGLSPRAPNAQLKQSSNIFNMPSSLFRRQLDPEQLQVDIHLHSPGPEWQNTSCRMVSAGAIISVKNSKDELLYDGLESFGKRGDIVGCGIDFANDRIFFTVNGKMLDSVALTLDTIDISKLVYPTIGVVEAGTRVKINFGQEPFACKSAMKLSTETEEEKKQRINRALEQEEKRKQEEKEERDRLEALKVAEEAKRLESANALMDISLDKLATTEQALKALELNNNDINQAASWLFDHPQALVEIQRSLEKDHIKKLKEKSRKSSKANHSNKSKIESVIERKTDLNVNDDEITSLEDLQYNCKAYKNYMLFNGFEYPSDDMDVIHEVDPYEREWLQEIEGLLRQQGVDVSSIMEVMQQLEQGGQARANAMLMLSDVIDNVPAMKRKDRTIRSKIRKVKVNNIRIGEVVSICTNDKLNDEQKNNIFQNYNQLQGCYGIVYNIDKVAGYLLIGFYNAEYSSLDKWWIPCSLLEYIDSNDSNIFIGLETLDQVISSQMLIKINEFVNIHARRLIVSLIHSFNIEQFPALKSIQSTLLLLASHEYLPAIDTFNLSKIYKDVIVAVPSAFYSMVETIYNDNPKIILYLLKNASNPLQFATNVNVDNAAHTLLNQQIYKEINIDSAANLIISFAPKTKLPVGVSLAFYTNEEKTDCLKRFNGPFDNQSASSNNILIVQTNRIWFNLSSKDNIVIKEKELYLDMHICPLSTEFCLVQWLIDYNLNLFEKGSVSIVKRIEYDLQALVSFMCIESLPPYYKIVIFRILSRGLLAISLSQNIDEKAKEAFCMSVIGDHISVIFKELIDIYNIESKTKVFSMYFQNLLEVVALVRLLNPFYNLTLSKKENDDHTMNKKDDSTINNKESVNLIPDISDNERQIIELGFSLEVARRALALAPVNEAIELLVSGELSDNKEEDAMLAAAMAMSVGAGSHDYSTPNINSEDSKYEKDNNKNKNDDDNNKNKIDNDNYEHLRIKPRYNNIIWFDSYCYCQNLLYSFSEKHINECVLENVDNIFTGMEKEDRNKDHIELVVKEWSNWTKSMDIQLVHLIESLSVINENIVYLKFKTFADHTKQNIQNYNLLQTKSVEECWRRSCIILKFNRYLSEVLKMLDFSQTVINTTIFKYNFACVLSKHRYLIVNHIRNEFLEFVLNITNVKPNRKPFVVIDRLNAASFKESIKSNNFNSTDDIVSFSVFGQTMRQIMNTHPLLLRPPIPQGSSPHIAFEVKFQGESAIGEAGPYRQLFSDICRELVEVYELETSDKYGQCILPLFVQCMNKQIGIGENRDKYVIRPSSDSTDILAMYEFLGRLLGIALRTNILMTLDLPSFFWKPLVFQELTRDDLELIDKTFSSGVLDTIESFNNENSFNEFFDNSLTWKIMLSDKTEVDLKPGQQDVSYKESLDFARLAEQTRLRESELQSNAIRRGLCDIIPLQLLCICPWDDFERRICGLPFIDIDLLKRHTEYSSGVDATSEHIGWFWRVLEEWSQEERRKFIRFAWAQERLPSTDKEFRDVRMLIKHVPSDQNDDDRFPRVDTCFFNLELPVYSSLEIMRTKLNIVINLSSGMDADELVDGQIMDFEDDEFDEESDF